MFELPIWQLSGDRANRAGAVAYESVATFILLVTIFRCIGRARHGPKRLLFAAGLPHVPPVQRLLSHTKDAEASKP
jgi:hypothetical protein